jgi:uncharacterized protein RhaS with RHS repeats
MQLRSKIAISVGAANRHGERDARGFILGLTYSRQQRLDDAPDRSPAAPAGRPPDGAPARSSGSDGGDGADL